MAHFSVAVRIRKSKVCKIDDYCFITKSGGVSHMSDVFVFEEKDIEKFKETPNYKTDLLPKVEKLISLNLLSRDTADKLIRYKAEEYKVFTQNDKASKNLFYLLQFCYESFDITDYFVDSSVLKKYFLIVNKNSKEEYEKILENENLILNHVEYLITDDKSILIYSGLLKDNNDNPYLSLATKAQQAGINAACYYYSGKDTHENGVGFLYGQANRFSINDLSKNDRTNANGGYRNDLSSGFKSSWEANIARVLNFKSLKWLYEDFYINVPQSIYVPDFYYSSEGDEIILEVKGRWDSRSVEKMSYIIREETEYMLLLIDSDLYKYFDRNYNQLPYWEESKKVSNKFIIPILGVNIGSRKQYINSLNKGEEIFLVREPNNAYDSYAIKVINKDGHDLGYVKKEWAAIFSWKMDFGFEYKSTVYSNIIKGSSFQIELSTDFGNLSEHLIKVNLAKYHLSFEELNS